MSRDLEIESRGRPAGRPGNRIGWVVAVAVSATAGGRECEAIQPPAAAAALPAAAKDSPAAERTRGLLLKVKVTVTFKGVPLREALKEFAAQVEMQAERPVLWTYAEGVPADTAVTYSCRDKPLDRALDEVFTTSGCGYVIQSADDQPKDGWIRVTRGTERGSGADAGTPTPPAGADDADDKRAATRLGIAKELIAKGQTADAKAVLTLIRTKFPKSKAAAEAQELLEKLGK